MAANSGVVLLGKHQLAALISTALDFATMVSLVEFTRLGPVPATAAGALVGAISNFSMARLWIFNARSGDLRGQLFRYALVSLASLGWNTLGEYLVAVLLGVQYVAARVVVALAVSVGWNYPMHRFVVFRSGSEPREPG